MSNLGNQTQTLDMASVVVLWEIEFENAVGYTPNVPTTLRISPFKNGKDNLLFGGVEYAYVGVDASGFTAEMNGQLPTPEAEFDRLGLNANGVYNTIKQDYLDQTGQFFFDWRGARIRRITTTATHLDTGDDADTTKTRTEEYFVDQVTVTTVGTITVRLTTSISADKINNQSVQSLAYNNCSLIYRTWNSTTNEFEYTDPKDNGCPYGNPMSTTDWSPVQDFGNKYFNESNNTQETPQFDRCSKTGLGCQLRFDPDKDGLPLPIKAKLKRNPNG